MENRFKLADDYIVALPKTTDLYNKTWSSNSTCLLHAPREIDKTAVAVDIALDLTARDLDVFYLSVSRLSDDILTKMIGNRHLFVHQSDFAAPDDPTDFADIVFKDLEDAIAATGAKIFIIDSLTRIAALSFGRNASVSHLMKRIVNLQVRHKISVLVIHHDKSKAATRTLIDLADSDITLSPAAEDVPAAESDKKASSVKEVSRVADTRQPAPQPDTSVASDNPGRRWRTFDYSPFWDAPEI